MSIVIDFQPTGAVEAMHRDSFPLSFLGDMSIRRASELRFNEATQSWGIEVAEYFGEGAGADSVYHVIPEATGYQSYEDARTVEVAWFDACRLEGVNPRSERGLEILAAHNHEYFA